MISSESNKNYIRMPYAEIKGSVCGCRVLRGFYEGESAGVFRIGLSLNDRTDRVSEPGFGTVYSPDKYRETEGRKDCTGYTGGAGKGAIKEIDYDMYIDQGNMQGCDAVKTFIFRDFANYNDAGNPGKYPLYPTHPTDWTQLRYQKWNGEDWKTIGPVPSTWYDCSTWGTIGKTYLAVGAYATGGAVTPEYSDPVTILAQSGSTTIQNFAFDGMDDID